jgi:hypothetical protein
VNEASTAAPSSSDSALSRIIGVFFSPGQTFASIAARPTWLAPVILMTIVGLGATALIMPKMDYDPMIREVLERQGQTVTDESVAAMRAQFQMFGNLAWVWAGLGATAMTLLLGGIFLGAFKAFGRDLRYKQSLGATSHAFLPSVLSGILLAIVVSQRESISPESMGDAVRSNLGFLVDPSSKALHALLGSIDVFSIWIAILLSIGYAAATKTRVSQAAPIVFGLWILFVLIKAGWAAAFG